MKVALRMPDGSYAAGSIVKVTIKAQSVAGLGLLAALSAVYDQKATSDQSGIATFPDPGVKFIDRIASIEVSHKTTFGTYSYYGTVETDILGRFPDSVVVTLSSQIAKQDSNPFVAITDNAKWIVLGVLGIVVLGSVNSYVRHGGNRL